MGFLDAFKDLSDILKGKTSMGFLEPIFGNMGGMGMEWLVVLIVVGFFFYMILKWWDDTPWTRRDY